MLRTAGVVSSIVSCFLLSACFEGGGAAVVDEASAERIVTADDLEGSGELELDLAAEPVRFSFAAGPIDLARVVVIGEDGRRAHLQDLLAVRGEAWGVNPAKLGLGDSFVVDAAMVADAVRQRPTALMVAQQAALARLPRIDQVVAADDGVPSFITGDLGFLAKGEPRTAAQAFLQEVAPVFRMHAATDLEPMRVKSDELGQVHVKFSQYLHDLPVVGGELTVHSDGVSGRVSAVSGRFIAGEELAREPVIEGEAALKAVLAGLPADAVSDDVPDLVYVVTEAGASLAWQTEVSYTGENGPERDLVFVDAVTGEIAARHPQIHRALSRKVYDTKKSQNLPGTEIANPGASADLSVRDAFTYAGTTYDFYKARFNRDSYNGAGATIKSTVHFGVNYDNAFWEGNLNQMVYGDGSGTYFSSLARDLDIVAHELTHAVTQYEANLVYQNQSGALNEAFSDIMAASLQAHVAGGVVSAATWKLAEASWTPGTANDAMRYMDDPIKDGQSYDYWPTRYQGTGDYGGVHLNSGIGNLAFKLLVTGGVHPRGKTANNVPGIGITKASKIFYDALATYLSSNATFQDARNATAQAATALHGAASPEVAAVHAAWTAVGVPGDPGNGGGGGGGGSCTGTVYNGSLSGPGAQQAQPNGSYYQTTGSKTHKACLTAGNGTDFDLYLFKWNGNAWAQVAKSEGETSSETISYAGTAGYYSYTVSSYAGAGAYTLTAGVQ